jgi:hypothetical protein
MLELVSVQSELNFAEERVRIQLCVILGRARQSRVEGRGSSARLFRNIVPSAIFTLDPRTASRCSSVRG